MTLPATDNFNRANAVGLGANWTVVNQNFSIVSNQAAGTTAGDNNIVRWSADTFPNDQYAQLTIAQVGDGGPAVRVSGTALANANGYFIDSRGGSDVLKKFVAGAETQIGTLTTYANGDIAKITAVGTTITPYRNGVLNTAAVVDASLASGSAGMENWDTGCLFDDWEGGTFASAYAAQSQPLLPKPLTLLRCRPLGCGNPLREVKYYGDTATVSGGTDITPGVGLLVLDGFAPSVGLPITLVPGAGALDLTGFAARFPTTLVPGSGALTLNGFGPLIGLPKTVVPGFGQLSLSGFSATFPRTIVPATGALDLNGFAPTFARTIKPGFGDLQLNGFPASFSFVSGGYTAQLGSGVLTLAGFTPTIGLPRTLQPGSGVLVLSGNAPAIGLPITVRPALGQITLSGFGPTIYFTPPGITLVPGTGQLTLTGYAPFIGTFTFRITGGPVMTATITAGGVLVASILGGPVLTSSMTGGPV